MTGSRVAKHSLKRHIFCGTAIINAVFIKKTALIKAVPQKTALIVSEFRIISELIEINIL